MTVSSIWIWFVIAVSEYGLPSNAFAEEKICYIIVARWVL